MKEILQNIIFLLMFTVLIFTIIREYQNTSHSLSDMEVRLSGIEATLNSFEFEPIE